MVKQVLDNGNNICQKICGKIEVKSSEGELSKAFDKMYEHHRNVSADLTQLLPRVRAPVLDDV